MNTILENILFSYVVFGGILWAILICLSDLKDRYSPWTFRRFIKFCLVSLPLGPLAWIMNLIFGLILFLKFKKVIEFINK